MDSAEKGTYEAGKTNSSEMKTILESFYDVAAEDSAPQQLDEIASVTMSGDSADEVAQLVKLMNAAGAPEAAPVGPQPTTMLEPTPCGTSDGPPDMPPKADMITPKMLDDIASDEEVIQDEYANEPDERYDDHEKMTHDLSGGLNRQKGAYADAEDGDNPMAVESKLKEELSKMLKQKMSEKKGAKPDFLDLDDDGDTEEPMKQAAKDKKKGAVGKKKTDTEVEEAGKLKGGAKDPCWKGYKMVGTKKKDGKEVPNCVPREGVEKTKHKGDKITMEAAPVFNRYVTPFIDKTPHEIVQFYDREAMNILDRLSEERRTLANKGANTAVYDTVIGNLRGGLSALSEETLTEMRRRSGYGRGRTYTGGWSAFPSGRDKGVFVDRSERDKDIAYDEKDSDEWMQKSRSSKKSFQRQSKGNYNIRIQGKVVKDKQGNPFKFSNEQSAQKAADTMSKKDWNKGKKIEVIKVM